ncbi:uncharacterized protein DNG_07705 [Cephalotrichum gorgonifer]|uniref:CID domain-containing protein n=1 Tax=Cephalotrichum gorgonifer TaxID=2041049 RepID=A0AAE8N569_9PEZI|nr:uncharacterized protein DNG_07705 [Cephalotrichum gorgonifer]
MSSRNPPDSFPNLESKLQNPSRKSAFERQKAEAEAKRRREAAETAAALEDFVKSFEEDDAGASRPGYSSRGGMGVGGGGPGAGFGGRGGRPGGPGKRHFVQTGMKSGPGSLGPAPGGFVKKRAFDTFRSDGGRGGDRGTLSYEDQEFSGQSAKGIARAFRASDDEDEAEGPAREEEMIARPTLQLAQLPPGMSLAAMKALIPGNLAVESVKIVPGASRAHGERKSTVAIVILSQDTPANEIDAAVSQLQNRYLGFGFYLSIHRHLSSAVSSSIATSQVSASSTSAQPFGAKPVAQGSASQQGGGGFHRGFAPPTSYGPPSTIQRSSLMHVPVQPPQDIKTVQMVSMVIEGLLEHGPEFEALLMTRPDVQKEEKWAWIWNPRSEAGVWYRWKLWQVVTGAQSSRGREKYHPIFEDSHAWKEPTKGLPFEYVAELDELVSDPDYNSSDDEEWEGDGSRDNPAAKEVDKTFLNPLEKARLTHLLSRLPTTLSHIKKGDIARVTAFAITHASRGADEVVDLIVSNIDKPLALSGANPQRKHAGKDRDASPELEEAGGNKAGSDGSDMSGANLVGLYIISDILSSSSTSVVRHAWRYRQLFEAALKGRKTFEKLGMMAHRHGWGRLRAEKWKRSVGLILNLWEGWCVFPAESQELFVRSFDDPPELRAARKAEEVSEEKKGRWKPVEATAAEVQAQAHEDRGEPMNEDDVVGEELQEEDVEGEPMSDGDAEGEPMEEDDDPEGEPMEESDAEGVPMEESEPEGEAMEESDGADGGGVEARGGTSAGDETPAPALAPASVDEGKQAGAGPVAFSSARKGQPRSRMRAVDMFADSDDEGEGRP